MIVLPFSSTITTTSTTTPPPLSNQQQRHSHYPSRLFSGKTMARWFRHYHHHGAFHFHSLVLVATAVLVMIVVGLQLTHLRQVVRTYHHSYYNQNIDRNPLLLNDDKGSFQKLLPRRNLNEEDYNSNSNNSDQTKLAF